MEMKSKTKLRLAVLAIAAFLVGCAAFSDYYKVTDPTSGRVYYTGEIERQKDKGSSAIRFKDANTGAEVTLSSSEVLEVSSDEFKKGTAK